MTDSLHTQVVEAFTALTGVAPSVVVRAPGRVNLIGEHTDYNEGYVFPLAIDRAVWIAARPRADDTVRVHLLDYDETASFRLGDLVRGAQKHAPIEYLRGVAWALAGAGYHLRGWEGVIVGDVPIGAGLSSSAALEVAVARAFSAVSGFDWDAAQMAKLCQKAENQWVGVNSGIMDQMISACGVADHALLIDCRTLDTAPAPLPPGTVVVILDSDTRRGLVGSAYNERRQQCEDAARFFGVRTLRDVSPDEFHKREHELTEPTRRRARHVITENARTLNAQAALLAGDAVAVGRLMAESHASLRDDFEVSTPALDAIVTCSLAHPACYGARMTGAGFGGCGVALVRADRAEDFVAEVSQCYRQATGLTPRVYVCRATDGAQVIR